MKPVSRPTLLLLADIVAIAIGAVALITGCSSGSSAPSTHPPFDTYLGITEMSITSSLPILPAPKIVSITLQATWGSRGNGNWEFVVTAAGGVEKVVMTEAEGYVSAPVSYTIHLDGLSAYLVDNGQLTDQEASHLDFHFEAK